MPMVNPNTGPGGPTAALDALQRIDPTAGIAAGDKPNPWRLTERPYPPPATPPNEQPFGVPRPRHPKPSIQGLMTMLPGPKTEQ